MKEAFRAKCNECRHVWVAMWLPMRLDLAIEVLRGIRCPACGSAEVMCTQSPADVVGTAPPGSVRTVIAQITDTAALALIRIEDVHAYLGLNGWREQDCKMTKEIEFRRGEGLATQSLWVPRDNSFADYPARMSDLLRALAAIEGRSETDVFANITGRHYE